MTGTDTEPPESTLEPSADHPATATHRPPSEADQRRQDERDEQSFPGSDPPGIGGPSII